MSAWLAFYAFTTRFPLRGRWSLTLKPQVTVSVLVAMLLLALPGSAWAQVALGGQVKYADGTVAAGARVFAYPTAGGTSQNATADASGMYVVYVTPGTYNLSVEFNSPYGFYGSQQLAANLNVSTSTALNLTLGDIILNGRIINSAGQPVPNVQLSGYFYGQNTSGNLYPYSDAEGRFQVRMVPGDYYSLQLTPPSGTPYATTALPNQTFSTSGSQDFVLSSAIALSGQVKYADGTAAAGARVFAYPTAGGPSHNATADASGMYTVYLVAGTYNLNVEFNSPYGFYGSQQAATNLSISANTTRNLTLNDIILNGRIINSAGQPVPNVQLSGYFYGQNTSGNLYPYSGADGRFQVRMVPGDYYSLQLTPPSGTPYAITALPNQTFSTSGSQDFVLSNAIALSGHIMYADGTAAAGARVFAYPTAGGPSHNATADASGAYTVYLVAGTYNLNVEFNSPYGFYGSQQAATNQNITASASLNLALSDIVLNGRVINSAGQPVPNVQLSGYFYGQNTSGNLYPYSGADGRFQVRMVPGDYYSLQLNPGTNSGYMQTPLPNQTFSTSGSQDFVVTDVDECGYSNGGCSANAACTNTPGSRTCACNPGYSGDGVTCEPIPGRIIINEILANEPGSATAGEFVELVNVGAASVDLSGWKLWDGTSARHTFAAGTVLAPGKALVVFGAASGIPAGLTNAVAASTATLNLANTTDTVTVKNAAGTNIDTFTYGSSLASADGVSMNRGPDTSATAGFVLHNSLSNLSSSAGKRVNGAAF
jgi:hypothetical protein